MRTHSQVRIVIAREDVVSPLHPNRSPLTFLLEPVQPPTRSSNPRIEEREPLAIVTNFRG